MKSEVDIAAYLTIVIEDGDSAELEHVLGECALERGMTEGANAAGISRESLYKALRSNSHPRFDTISRVCSVLGIKLIAQAVQKEEQP